MLSSASLKCLSRQELQAGNKFTLTFYKVIKEAEIEFSESSFEEIIKSRPGNLVRYEELRKVCRDSDAALISGNNLELFINLKKVSPSIQLLKIPAVVKEILIAKALASNNTTNKNSEPEFTGLKLEAEKIELSEELIAFDSVIKGDLDNGIYALKIVSDKLSSVITIDEVRKYLGKQLKTSPRKPPKKKRKKKSRRKKKRRKTTKRTR
ncbi:MAG: hypothetical protein QN229_01610 [Desulfurococcaceae archaeon TW002]